MELFHAILLCVLISFMLPWCLWGGQIPSQKLSKYYYFCCLHSI